MSAAVFHHDFRAPTDLRHGPPPRPNPPVGIDGFVEDVVWNIRNEAKGAAKVVRIDWRLDPPAGVGLDPVAWDGLVHMAKMFCWSLLAHNARGLPITPGGLEVLHPRLVYFVRWMAANGHSRFSDIDRDIAWQFRDDLSEDKGVFGTRPALKIVTLGCYLDVPCRIFEQGGWRMQDTPGATMAQAPFGSLRANRIASEIGVSGRGEIPPVPDEVWLRAVETALTYVDVTAQDVVRLGTILAAHASRAGSDVSPDGDGMLRTLRGADADGYLEAWLADGIAADWKSEIARRPNATLWGAYLTILGDTRDACTIMIQAMLGLRISEVAGLEARASHSAPSLTSCVTVEASSTGMNEIFYVDGFQSKGRGEPEPARWIAGSRSLGSDALPAAIRAIAVLEQTFRPWRELGRLDDLIVDFAARHVPPLSKTDVRSVMSSTLDYGQKRFLHWLVDVPEHFRDHVVSTHQWRKSFALYMVRTDERLLPAVSRHFKHINIAVTEQSYVGSDPRRLGIAEDEAVREAVATIFEALNGDALLAGGAADAILAAGTGLAGRLEDCRTPAEKRRRLAAILDESDVKVWTSPWGKCLFRPEGARCHVRANGSADLLARKPDYAHRCPALCARCDNLLVSRTHEPFWRSRHAENLAAVKSAAQAGEFAMARIAGARLAVSFAILKDLDPGLRMPDLGVSS